MSKSTTAADVTITIDQDDVDTDEQRQDGKTTNIRELVKDDKNFAQEPYGKNHKSLIRLRMDSRRVERLKAMADHLVLPTSLLVTMALDHYLQHCDSLIEQGSAKRVPDDGE